MTGRAGAPQWRLALVLGLVLNLALILAACAPRLQTPGPGPVIPYFDGNRMVMADGDRRPFRQWSPAGDGRPRAVVIALHGFGDHGQAFETVGAALAARGIAVIAPDQRVFGRSRARGIWPSGRTLVADLAVIGRLVAARYPGRPIFVLGESMGGAVAMVARAEGLPVAGVDPGGTGGMGAGQHAALAGRRPRLFRAPGTLVAPRPKRQRQARLG